MASRDRRSDRAQAHRRRILTSTIRELAETRRALGLSQRELGASIGLSESQVARTEAGSLDDLGIGRLCRLAAGLGLEVSLRLYPLGEPVRDAGHLRLDARLRARLSPTVQWQTEVPLPIAGDLRAWDGVASGTGCRDGFELETRIGDVQAVERRIQRKVADDPTVAHVFLILADTRQTRLVLAAERDRLRGNFPLDTREVLSAFSAGRCPGASGIVVL